MFRCIFEEIIDQISSYTDVVVSLWK